MAWMGISIEQSDFFDEIAALPDRTTGLLAGVLIDQNLDRAIRKRLFDFPTKGGNLVDDLFRDGGEIGSFGARVKIGAAIGLYGSDTYKDLIAVNKIRNAFAHKFEVRNFSDQPVVDMIRDIKLPSSFLADPDPNNPSETTGNLWETSIKRTPYFDTSTARGKFIRTMELLSILIIREWVEPNTTPTPRF